MLFELSRNRVDFLLSGLGEGAHIVDMFWLVLKLA